MIVVCPCGCLLANPAAPLPDDTAPPRHAPRARILLKDFDDIGFTPGAEDVILAVSLCEVSDLPMNWPTIQMCAVREFGTSGWERLFKM